MQILVINSGSSSIKFQLFEMPSKKVLCSGLVERIGQEEAQITYKKAGEKYSKTTNIPDHKIGLELVVSEYLLNSEIGVIGSTDDISAVGHRVVHGGSSFSDTVEITSKIKKEIENLFGLAPLHNPANLQGIEVAEVIFSNAKQVAVFDTAFHQTLPLEAYKYAIKSEFLEEHNIRAYGFHGTSHKYVSERAIEYLGAENSKNIITIHLGNGCSITAVKDGKSIDTSMGLAPLNGLIMGTRCGDIDPSAIFFLQQKLGYDTKQTDTLLNKESGMIGLTGFSDLRDIEDAAENGNKVCQEALDMAAYRIKKYIGSYATIMNGIDAIVFTAGVGENSDIVRGLTCKGLDFLGIELNLEKNAIRSSEVREIQSDTSRVKVLVIPTDEEAEIASQAYDLVQ